MSIATFESPQVASQQFFPWVFDEDTDCDYSVIESVQEFETKSEVVCRLSVATAFTSSSLVCESRSIERMGTETRLGKPVRLGAVMVKLLKSYGITDEEIAEGMAAYAAQAGLAQESIRHISTLHGRRERLVG